MIPPDKLIRMLIFLLGKRECRSRPFLHERKVGPEKEGPKRAVEWERRRHNRVTGRHRIHSRACGVGVPRGLKALIYV